MTGEKRNDILYVSNILREVFGINSPVYFPHGSKESFEAGKYQGITLIPEDNYETTLYQSEFGTPVLGAITFEHGEYNTYNLKTGEVIGQRMEDYTLPYSCIVDFSRDNNVTTTSVLGGTGTVKELYGLDDWNLTIRGVALNPRSGNGMSAHEQIERLTQWCSLCDSIQVLGSMFMSKKIKNIVVKSFTVQPLVGRWGAIPFQIDAVSDEPLEYYML